MQQVLIVDDEEAVRGLMSKWLTAAGYRVAAAGNQAQALSALEREPPAVAVCDLHLADGDGMSLVSQIRERCPETAIIVATGARQVETAVDCFRLGVVDFLTKPFTRDMLAAMRHSHAH